MLFAEDSQFISNIGNVKRRHDIQLTTKLSDTIRVLAPLTSILYFQFLALVKDHSQLQF